MTAAVVNQTTGLPGYDNIAAAGLSNLIIQGISGVSTSYQVWNEAGLVTSGSWPATSMITTQEAHGTSVSMDSPFTLTVGGSGTPLANHDVVVLSLTGGAGYTSIPTLSTTGWIWTEAVAWSGSHGQDIWVGASDGTTNTFTVTTHPSSAGKQVWYGLARFTNVTPYHPVTTSSAAGSNPSGTLNVVGAPDFTPQWNGELAVSNCIGNFSGNFTGPYSGSVFTQFPDASGTGFTNAVASAYYIQSTSALITSNPNGSPNAGWSLTGGANPGNYSGIGVALSPSTGGTTLSIPYPGGGNWPPGYFYVVALNGSTVVDSVQVTLVRNTQPSPSVLPAVSTLPAYGTTGAPADSGVNTDLYLHGFTAHGPERYQITSGTQPTVAVPPLFSGPGEPGQAFPGTIAGIQTDIAFEVSTSLYYAAGQVDPARPRPAIVAFPNDRIIQSGAIYTGATTGSGTNGQYSNASAIPAAGSYLTGVQSVVSTLFGITGPSEVIFEGVNEPDTGMLSDADSGYQFATFQGAVAAGNASAKAMGPAAVQIAYNGGQQNPQVANVVTWLNSAITTHGGTVGAFSGHWYNEYNGDFLVSDPTLAQLITALTSAGISGVPRFLTEKGFPRFNFSGHLLLCQPMYELSWAGQLYETWERNGWPKEHIYLYPDGAHGDPNGACYLKEHDQGLRSSALLLRTRSEELWGKTWQSNLTCGTIGDKLYRATVYGPGSSGSGAAGCVVLTAQGMLSDTITLGGLTSGTVTTSTWSGITNTVSVSGGNAVIPVSSLPTYVRISAGDVSTVNVNSAGAGVGSATNLARTATPSVGTTPVGTFNGVNHSALSALSTLTLNTTVSTLGFGTSGQTGTIITNNGAHRFKWTGTSGSTLTGCVYEGTQSDTVATGAVITPGVGLTNGGFFPTGTYLTSASPLSQQDWCFQTTTTTPVAYTWGSSQSITHVVIRQLAPWTDVGIYPSPGFCACAMLTGTLKYWNGSTWTACPTVAQGHWDNSGNYNNTTASGSNVFAAQVGHNTDLSYIGYYSAWDYEWVLNVPFRTTVSTTALQLTINTSSAGHIVGAATSIDNVGQYPTISEFMAFNIALPPPPSEGQAGFFALHTAT